MRKLRLVSLGLAAAVMLTSFVGCGSDSSSSASSSTASEAVQSTDSGSPAKAVDITFLNSKGEIQSQLEEAAKVFTNENPNIKIEIVPCPTGKSPFEVMSTMYNSGNAPTLAMIDAGDIPRLKDNFVVLDGEKWVAEALEGTTNSATIDGKLYAFPFAVEGFGFVYNKKVLDEAFGGSFDPNTITTRTALKDAFDKVEKIGKKALIVSPMDWSLGSHMISYSYIAAGKGDQATYDKMFADLKAGTYDLSSVPEYNGWIETFDLLKQYNYGKNDPLSVTYEKGPEVLGKGEVGFWFMGNWAWPQIQEFDSADKQYGFVSFPMSDNSSDFASGKIVSFASKFVGIDNKQSSADQQEAAKKFLNWIVFENSGQDQLVNKMNLVPAFKNITTPIPDPLGSAIKSAMGEGKTINAIDVYTVIPADHWAKVGASLQKYLSNNTDKAGLTKEIVEYWKTAE